MTLYVLHDQVVIEGAVEYHLVREGRLCVGHERVQRAGVCVCESVTRIVVADLVY